MVQRNLLGDKVGPGSELNDLTEAERQELAASVFALCRKMAREKAAELRDQGRRVDADELEGDAMLAAVQAAREFDPARGERYETRAVKFSTFARGFIATALLASTDERALPRVKYTDRLERLDRPGGDGGEEDREPVEPNDGQARLLGLLHEPARTVVRLVVFEGLTPDQAAARTGRKPKDIKLILRNAAADLMDRQTTHGADVDAGVERWLSAAGDAA